MEPLTLMICQVATTSNVALVTLSANQPTMRSPMPSNTTSDTLSFAASHGKVESYLPTIPALLFRSGLRIVNKKSPQFIVRTYRHGLDCVLKLLQLRPGSVEVGLAL